jgi:hypothetical protein
MKKQDVTYQDKLNELRLDIKHPNNKGIAFVLLEGESDIRLFRKLFSLDNCKVETIPGGKFKLEECVGEIVNIYPLIIGIRDADFVHLGKKPYKKKDVFLTDFHDMEMILASEDDVFGALVFEFTDFTKDKHSEIRNNIMISIEQISYLKWLNEKEHLGFQVDASFQDLISFGKLEVDFDQYFKRVLSKSPNATITNKEIVLQKMKTLKEQNPDSFQLCNGHDFIKALSQFVREKGDGRMIKDENISSSFRMTYTLPMFKKTKLFTDTKSWAGLNNCLLYAE